MTSPTLHLLAELRAHRDVLSDARAQERSVDLREQARRNLERAQPVDRTLAERLATRELARARARARQDLERLPAPGLRQVEIEQLRQAFAGPLLVADGVGPNEWNEPHDVDAASVVTIGSTPAPRPAR